MNYFKVLSWIERRAEEARQTVIGKHYRYWHWDNRIFMSNRLFVFGTDNWHLAFNGEIIKIGKSYKYKFRF
jgi:hypothetical protein